MTNQELIAIQKYLQTNSITKCPPGYAKTEPKRYKNSIANKGRQYNTLKG